MKNDSMKRMNGLAGHTLSSSQKHQIKGRACCDAPFPPPPLPDPDPPAAAQAYIASGAAANTGN